MIIAVETSTAFGSVAVVKEGRLLSETCMSVPRGHCENILPMLDRLLLETGMSVSSADAFAVSLGPGSFTALRIGMSTVKALCVSCGKPLVGVGTLDAISHNVAGLCTYICPIMDAKREEVFYSVYRDRNGRQERLTEYAADRPEQAVAEISSFLRSVGEGEVAFLGDGVGPCREFIRKQIKTRCLFPAAHVGIPRASSVGMLALELFKQGRVEDVGGVEPIYVRRSDAELRRQRTRD